MKNTGTRKANEIIKTSIALNTTLQRNEVRPLVRAHFVDTNKGIQGIAELINFILASKDAVLTAEEIDTLPRGEKINRGIRFDEIIAEVREAFGDARYPDSTIRVYLTTKAKNIFRLQMTSEEDAERTSPKPRCVYLLVA